MNPRETIERFDQYLAERSLQLEAVAVGGAALALLGVITRATKDCDILHPALPEAVQAAAKAFAAEQRAHGNVLDDDWLNNGPSSLADVLPNGWQERLQALYSGRAITLRCLGRIELLMSKLFALCDRGLDLADCVALAPTESELEEVELWLSHQDGNADWPAHVHATLDDLRRRLGHGV